MRVAAKAQQLATQAVAGQSVDKVSGLAGVEPRGRDEAGQVAHFRLATGA